MKETWLPAIENGHYSTWPGLTTKPVRKHFPAESIEIQKDHMKKQRQNVRSTKAREQQTVTDKIEIRHALTKQNLMVKVINAQQTVYTDQTGWFPVQSSWGNRLLMLIYNVDGNYIDVETMKDNKDNSMIKVYEALWGRITKLRENKPSMHILDNEASTAFKAAIKQNCNLQLVPPDTHCRNLAERAIQTFKSHFIAILAGVDPSFSMYLWDRLLPQTVLTLNLLRRAKDNQAVSAYEYVHGAFDYNKMPLAPLGCVVQMHDATNRRKTWDPQSLNGWYLGTSTEHYQCHRIFARKLAANGSPTRCSSNTGILLCQQ